MMPGVLSDIQRLSTGASPCISVLDMHLLSRCKLSAQMGFPQKSPAIPVSDHESPEQANPCQRFF